MIALNDRKTLTLGTAGMSKADAARIRAFISFCSARTACRWDSVREGSADVWIIGPEERDTLRGALEEPRALVRMVDAGVELADAPEHVIRRPLQLDDFFALLKRLETRIAGELQARRERLESSTGWMRTAPSRLDTLPAAPPPSRPPATASAATPAPMPQPAAGPVASDIAHKLKRWPPQPLLLQHPHYRRLATFLSARSMTLAELTRLSRLAPELCAAFVQAARQLGILESRVVEPRPAAAAPAAATASAFEPAARTPGRMPPRMPPVAGVRPLPVLPKAATPMPPIPAPAPAAPRPALGLFARIRLRLGIL